MRSYCSRLDLDAHGTNRLSVPEKGRTMESRCEGRRTTNRRSVTLLCGLLILCCGCSEDEALVRVKLYPDSLLTRDLITITVDDGRANWWFDSSSLVSCLGAWATPEIETKNYGSLLVKYRFSDPEGGVVSTGELLLDLRGDWRWGVDILPRDDSAIHTCMGCFGYKAFPILNPAYKTSEGDSVYIIWGGNSIDNPVVY